MTPPRSRVSGAHLHKYDPQQQSQREEADLSAGQQAEGFAKPTLIRRLIGLFGGVGLALIIFALMPGDIEMWPRLTAATAVLMAVWWMTEAIPIPATALLPLLIFPVLVPAGDAGSADEAAGGVGVDDVGASGRQQHHLSVHGWVHPGPGDAAAEPAPACGAADPGA